MEILGTPDPFYRLSRARQGGLRQTGNDSVIEVYHEWLDYARIPWCHQLGVCDKDVMKRVADSAGGMLARLQRACVLRDPWQEEDVYHEALEWLESERDEDFHHG